MEGHLEIKQRQTYSEIESLKPYKIKLDGEYFEFCLNCYQPIPASNTKYCSRLCSLEFFAKHNQEGLRQYLFEREHGKCQCCGYQYPYFGKPFPAKPQRPVFCKPRPDENDFPNYSKDNHRIGHFKNQLIRADHEIVCSCGALIHMGDYCYCELPMEKMPLDRLHSKYLLKHGCVYDPHCWSGCQKRDPQDIDSFTRRVFLDMSKVLCCEPEGIHCVNCGFKEIKEIEKAWNRDHRKALAEFKKAYKAWDEEYTRWVATGVFREFTEKEKAYFAAVEAWNKERGEWEKTADFQQFIADHIIPIALGGPEFDLENLQFLCRKCDKPKTARDQAIIAMVRKAVNGGALPVALQQFLSSEYRPLQERIAIYRRLSVAVAERVPLASVTNHSLETFFV